jgi:hypothetical protein
MVWSRFTLTSRDQEAWVYFVWVCAPIFLLTCFWRCDYSRPVWCEISEWDYITLLVKSYAKCLQHKEQLIKCRYLSFYFTKLVRFITDTIDSAAAETKQCLSACRRKFFLRDKHGRSESVCVFKLFLQPCETENADDWSVTHSHWSVGESERIYVHEAKTRRHVLGWGRPTLLVVVQRCLLPLCCCFLCVSCPDLVVSAVRPSARN